MLNGQCLPQLASLLSVCLTASVYAATYYVDFANGDNTADGLSPQRPWKHAPGDRDATDNPAAARLEPGDTVVFRGGIAYYGTINVTASGAPGRPIILDGNSAGTFGEGRAILDGARVIEGWKRLASAEEALGNPRWQEIFYADIDVDISSNVNRDEFVVHRQVSRDRQAPWQRIILIDGERRLLPIAQFPKPADPFYPDLPRDFLTSGHRLDVRDESSVITDEANLVAAEADAYDGMFVGVYGGNSHVYFARVRGFDPAAHQLLLPRFTASTYPQTQYAFYNSVRLIEQPGEWAIRPLADGRSRVYLLPERLEEGQPANIGYPEFVTGISIGSGASHLSIRSFLIQRYSGDGSGIAVGRHSTRSNNLHIADCEIRFISGHAGIGLNYCDEVLIERCYIHHCPAWTTGIFLSRVNDFVVHDCYLRKNSGSGIRHYEAKRGRIQDNAIMDHFGMHSSAINLYEGCEDVVVEGNYIENVIAMNRNARNITYRNNVIDSRGSSAISLAMWTSGSVGGRDISNVQILNNTFVNTNPRVTWAAGILGQSGANASVPTGIVVRGNILDPIGGRLEGVFENNIYLRESGSAFMSETCRVISDRDVLFMDAANGDYRRRPGGPAQEIGASVPPPAARPAGF